MKLLGTILILSFVFASSCNDTKKNEKSETNSEEKSTKKVEAPSMDIHAATFMGDLASIRKHIEAGTDLNLKEPMAGSTPLISASLFGRTEAAKLLIESGADLNIQNNEGSTALFTAAFLCRTEVVSMLLEKGADKNIKNNVGSIALDGVIGPFEDVKFIYDILSKELGPLGLKLDYKRIEETRPIIAEMLK